MERIHISFLLIFLLVALGSLVLGIFIADLRASRRANRERAAKLHDEAQIIVDREKAFSDRYGQ